MEYALLLFFWVQVNPDCHKNCPVRVDDIKIVTGFKGIHACQGAADFAMDTVRASSPELPVTATCVTNGTQAQYGLPEEE